MQFTRVRLTGFKSFVEPTELHIEPGLTGIVGPNGCGKSNLVEALRWVMGETSAKQVRGSEMDDVIFGGTEDRPARNLAEVLLSLDNYDRSAPAAYNEHAEIDVARRIERGSGSLYRVNGRDVRARDVQTLFADAATGARSTALVSQGRIGAIINAKPADRRHLLEEAAGISGLHARRHEAELRLRAADTNLERLDDLLITLDEQLRGLKRQARQASRYRNLSDHIRRAEAIVLYWRREAAVAARAEAAEKFAEAEEIVTASTREAASITASQVETAAGVPVRREAEAAAAARIRSVLVARDALDDEERRIEAARADLDERAAQIDGDLERERTRRTDADEALSRLRAETQSIRANMAGEQTELAEAARRLAEAATETGAQERRVDELNREVAGEEARRQELTRKTEELAGRRQQLRVRAEQLAAERLETEARADDGGRYRSAQEAVAEARERREAARSSLEATETGRTSAQEAETVARDALRRIESEAAKVEAESTALTELLEVGDPDLWPPMIDAVTVETGYEVALGAALGDDLTASNDEAAPVHWRARSVTGDAPLLPMGARPLSQHVSAPPALARRLAQIGVVEDDDTGNALSTSLAQGQRLVSTSGALWRWDGFTAGVGAPSSAANRLAQRNRLAELRTTLDTIRQRATAAGEQHDKAAAGARDAIQRDKDGREALSAADRAVQDAQDAEAAIAREATDARARLAALEEAEAGVGGGLRETDEQITETEAALNALPEIAHRQSERTEAQNRLAEHRRELAEWQYEHDRVAREAEGRATRLQAIDVELRSWEERATTATGQIDQLTDRRRRAGEELEKLAQRPNEIAEQRAGLLDRIGDAEAERNAAADALAEAEAELEAITARLRATEARLADEREERVRCQAAVEHAEQSLTVIAERITERLECGPDDVLASVGLSADDDLPDGDKTEIRLERLQRERDNMGPVNLRADAEAAEIDERIRSLQTERDDLVAAIQRLRQGISGLNREGRDRLQSAFGEIDRHFRDLFTRLFGGGSAHLAMTDADDPFESGLEVMASPPGKRLQSMSLLSGGEQALAALALLFAVFLTNPAPICVLDEVDAPLDDHNVDRFCDLVAEIAHASSTRFLLITHHRLTMARMDRLYGVTMAERGVSQLVSVDLETAEAIRETA